MATFERQTVIDASPADVFSVLTDLDQAHEFMPDIRRIRMLTEGPMRVGTKWKETRILRVFGFIPVPASAVIEVTEYEAGKRYVTVADDGCNWAAYEFEVTGAPGAHCRVHLLGRFRMVGKCAKKPARAERLRDWCEKADGELLDRLKAYVEGE